MSLCVCYKKQAQVLMLKHVGINFICQMDLLAHRHQNKFHVVFDLELLNTHVNLCMSIIQT